jgi:protein SCO1/2
MALILEPLTLVGAVMVVWGRDLSDGLGALRGRRAGRALLAGTAVATVLGLSLVVLRVAGANSSGESFDPAGGAAVRRSEAAPALALIDQAGARFGWERLGGRPAVVAFVFAHCATVCPTLVNDLLAARGRRDSPALILVTLDPWRDTPPRLAAIARQWRLAPRDFLLGGGIGEVETTVAGWGVPWQRDTLTGEIRHGTQLFVVEPAGRLEWVVAGGDAREAVRLAGR